MPSKAPIKTGAKTPAKTKAPAKSEAPVKAKAKAPAKSESPVKAKAKAPAKSESPVTAKAKASAKSPLTIETLTKTEAKAPVFTQASLKLLRELGARTDRGPWYHDNREAIENLLVAPARHLVTEVGDRLRLAIPDLVVEPRVDRGIYRLYRDTRFTNDKRPYKEHIGVVWWKDRPEGKMESPSFYFHLTPDGWLWSTGIYRFTPAYRRAYIRTLADQEMAAEFLRIIKGLKRLGLEFGEADLQTVPKELKGSPVADWGRRKGLGAWSSDSASLALGPKAASLIAARFEKTLDFFKFLSDIYLEIRPEEVDEREAARETGGGPRRGAWTDDF